MKSVDALPGLAPLNVNRIVVALAALVIGVSACGSDAPSATDDRGADQETSTTAAPTTSIDDNGITFYEGISHGHTDAAVDYTQSPPVGGYHAYAWQNCGVYDAPVIDENAVHSMEHGAVWLAYDPSLTDEQVEVLRALASGESHVLVSPYEGLADGEAVVATAWGVQLRLDSVDNPRLAAFVATYQKDARAPEPGATCAGAIGEPIQ
ncbi:MAG: DUF3105 domain-containing protein [Ilumatobacteraceae bacterium]